MNFLFLLMLVVVTERITEIIVDSELTAPLRKKIKKWVYGLDKPPEPGLWFNIKTRIDYLINCGYCASVWVGLFVSGIVINYCSNMRMNKYFDNYVVEWIIVGLFMHGMSNLYHVVYMLIMKGRILTADIMISKPESKPVLGEEDG